MSTSRPIEATTEAARDRRDGPPAPFCLSASIRSFQMGQHLRGDVDRCDQGTYIVGQLAIVFARTKIKLALTSIRSFGDQFAFGRETFKTFKFGLKTDHLASPKTRY